MIDDNRALGRLLAREPACGVVNTRATLHEIAGLLRFFGAVRVELSTLFLDGRRVAFWNGSAIVIAPRYEGSDMVERALTMRRDATAEEAVKAIVLRFGVRIAA